MYVAFKSELFCAYLHSYIKSSQFISSLRIQFEKEIPQLRRCCDDQHSPQFLIHLNRLQSLIQVPVITHPPICCQFGPNFYISTAHEYNKECLDGNLTRTCAFAPQDVENIDDFACTNQVILQKILQEHDEISVEVSIFFPEQFSSSFILAEPLIALT